MADVQNMKQIFMTAMLRPVLTNLTVRTKEEMWKNSSKRWSDRRISQPYIEKMGKLCSVKLALCLNRKEITYDQLCAVSVISSSEEFDEWLEEAGIRRKKWRDNIRNHFSFHLF